MCKLFKRTPARYVNTRIGDVYRDSTGKFRYTIMGVIPNLTPLESKLWAIFTVLKIAFIEGHRDVIVETENLLAFLAIKNFSLGVQANVYDYLFKIDIRLHDVRWFCLLSFIFLARNIVARYIAWVAMELDDRLYTLNRPVTRIEELLDWDTGMGPVHPDYVDVHYPDEAPDSINFKSSLTLTNNVENPGFGISRGTHNSHVGPGEK